MIAERAVATYPNLSEAQVADATVRLQPFLDEMSDGLSGLFGEAIPLPLFVVSMAAGNFLVLIVVPSLICALLFRWGLLMYIFGIAVVTKNGARASRLQTFWRSLVTWSPCVLLPTLVVFLTVVGLAKTWSLYLSLAVFIALIAWSVSMPVRNIPDRIAGTYPARVGCIDLCGTNSISTRFGQITYARKPMGGRCRGRPRRSCSSRRQGG